MFQRVTHTDLPGVEVVVVGVGKQTAASPKEGAGDLEPESS